MARSAEFEVYDDHAGLWRWRLRAPNGDELAESAHSFREKRDCERSVNLVKLYASEAEVVPGKAPERR